jgi:tetratricopeptide (TPR) repeat protein
MLLLDKMRFSTNSINYITMTCHKLIPTSARAAAFCCIASVFFAAAAYAAPADDIKEAGKLYQQGKLDVALTKVNSVLTAQPKDAQGRFLKGLILTEQKKGDEAIRVFTGLTEDFPELPEPYNNLAVLYASQGNYDKAKAALELAIHTHPSYATAHENLGDIYAQLARRAYDKALQLDKNNTAAQAKLSMIKDLFSPPKSIVPAPATMVAGNSIAKTEPAKAAAVTQPAAPSPAAPSASPVAQPAAPAQPSVKAPSASAEAQVKSAVNKWAKAWSDRNVAAYLAAYAPDFETPGGEARGAWEQQRRERIEKPKSISVNVKINSVTVNGLEALVTLRQGYRSDSFKSNSTKTLRLVRNGDKWLIRQERVAS